MEAEAIAKRGEEYRRAMIEGETTQRGAEATDSFYGGISPREYLILRGWRNYNGVKDAAGILEGWVQSDFRHPIYDGPHTLEEALLAQYRQEVECLGGYENFVKLIDERGVHASELQY